MEWQGDNNMFQNNGLMEPPFLEDPIIDDPTFDTLGSTLGQSQSDPVHSTALNV
jgi:hypothetical protein